MESESTVFVVDDDEAVSDALRLLLSASGFRVEMYNSARAFLDNYDPGRRGCLVLDVYLPGMDGLELQQKLRERNCSLPIVFITGHGDRHLAAQAYRAGAAAFFEKPFSSSQLLEQLSRLMTTCHSARS